MTDRDIRQHPDAAFIAAVRARFPTEPEVDEVLSRKMQRRGGPGYQAVSIETLSTGAQRLISAELGYPVKVAEARWLSGGASKLQMRFELHWRGGWSRPDRSPNRAGAANSK